MSLLEMHRAKVPTVVLTAAIIVLPLCVAVTVVGVLSIEGLLGPVPAVGVIFALIMLFAAFFVPIGWLPSLALVLYLFVPRTILALNDLTATFTPSFVVVLIWLIRIRNRRSLDEAQKGVRATSGLTVLIAVLATWMVIVLTAHGFHGRASVWLIDFAVLFLLPLLIPISARTLDRLQRTFLWSALIMAVLCVIEFLLTQNLFSTLYAAAGVPELHRWSVYRSFGTLGHPLYAGMFFAVAFGIALGRRFQGASGKNLFFALVSLGGLLTTVSRSSVGAAAVAGGLIIIVALFQSNTRISTGGKLFFGLLVLGATAGIIQAPVFQDRLGSSEVVGSTLARNSIWSIAFDAAAATNWLGSGPGTSIIAVTPYNSSGMPVENGYLQLLISIGIPGLLLFAALLAYGLINAVRTRSYAALGGLAAYVFAIGFFNILEGSRTSLIFGGLILLLACSARRTQEIAPVTLVRSFGKADDRR